jgi:hypothetical protein
MTRGWSDTVFASRLTLRADAGRVCAGVEGVAVDGKMPGTYGPLGVAPRPVTGVLLGRGAGPKPSPVWLEPKIAVGRAMRAPEPEAPGAVFTEGWIGDGSARCR